MWDDACQWIESVRAEDLEYLGQQPYLSIGAAALALLLLWLAVRLRPRRRIMAFKGDTGPVEISRHALLELVRSACEQLPEVRKPAIRIRARRKLNLCVRIRVDGSARLRDTASFLQSHIKDALENNLGVERLGRIEILVTGIRSSAPRKLDLNPPPAKDQGGSGGKPALSSPEDRSSLAGTERSNPDKEPPSGNPGEQPAGRKPEAAGGAAEKPRPDLNPRKQKESPPSAPEEGLPKGRKAD